MPQVVHVTAALAGHFWLLYPAAAPVATSCSNLDLSLRLRIQVASWISDDTHVQPCRPHIARSASGQGQSSASGLQSSLTCNWILLCKPHSCCCATAVAHNDGGVVALQLLSHERKPGRLTCPQGIWKKSDKLTDVGWRASSDSWE